MDRCEVCGELGASPRPDIATGDDIPIVCDGCYGKWQVFHLEETIGWEDESTSGE
jgi:hypothetical protein